MNNSNINIEPVRDHWQHKNNITLDVLRLDKIHEVVSGNKWFKLKYYLMQAKQLGKNTIATFGGAWSNHIVATAYATREAGFKSIGIIRGEKPIKPSITLQDVAAYGMKLMYVSREEYKHKEAIMAKFANEDWYWVDEGGYGKLGMQGASGILTVTDTTAYTHIVAAVGTGTMLSGLIAAAQSNQKIIGISSMKGNHDLELQVKNLLDDNSHKNFEIFHEYHFGGYGKHPQQLINFINDVYAQHQLPLDIVYTAKTFWAIKDLVEKNYFEEGSRLLMIHSGGLQGNKSLGAKVLAF